ncbi:DUF4244 domain-containing protein [Arthrobacter sedimenti]|uniref:DUF4244 domain-containing protein n=1 Tax=Arthrobacter sedimenti TaxID=2694931 RepID=UPI001CDB984D|nr:DUF4244 domain-containing protein [Arthrobacter sedimenti]
MSSETHARTLEGSSFRVPAETQNDGSSCTISESPVDAVSPEWIPGQDGRGGFGDPEHAGDRAARRADARRRRSNARIIRHRQDGVPGGEAGMATAEYAIATLAAVAFAALLVAVLSSGEVKGLLMSLITSALNFG